MQTESTIECVFPQKEQRLLYQALFVSYCCLQYGEYNSCGDNDQNVAGQEENYRDKSNKNKDRIDDIGVEIIAMRYGIV